MHIFINIVIRDNVFIILYFRVLCSVLGLHVCTIVSDALLLPVMKLGCFV